VPLAAAVVLAALGFVPVANLLGGGATIPWWSAAVREWLVAGTAVALVSLGLGRVLGERLDRSMATVIGMVLRPSPRTFQFILALLVFTLTAAFSVYCFARKPFAQDEMAQRFHAQMLLAGRLFAVGEPHPEFFSITGVLDREGRWYSMYPIGGPALLAAGAALHAIWLVNPVLTAVTACALYRFAATCYGDGTARASALLFALSPFVLIMGASTMNHAGALALATLALASLAKWTTAADERGAARAAVVIGLAVGGIATIRPLDAAAVALAVGLFQLAVVARDRGRARFLVLQVLAGALPVAWLLYVNARTTGHPLLFAYDALYGTGQRLGFHVDPLGVLYTPVRALALTSANLMRLDRYLFEWPLPGLVPIVAALLLLRHPTPWDLLLVGLMVAVIGSYGLYWAADSFFAGPRFLYTAVPAFVILAARAPGLFAETLRAGTLRRAALVVVPLCLCVGWLRPTGVSSVQMRAYYFHAGRTKLKNDIEAEVSAAHLTRALVFVHEPWRARLEARLRADGVTPGEASRILASSDACQVQMAVNEEDARESGDTAGRAARLRGAMRPQAPPRPVPGLQADATIFLADRVLPDACRRELAADTMGTTPYAPFLVLARFDPDGSVGGPVVFARDLGARNELLRTRFPDRMWFRYRPRVSLEDTTTAIVPY
jgi:hypothetical protein